MASTPTAKMMNRPVKMANSWVPKPASTKMFWVKANTSAPRTVPTMVPSPPKRFVPPMTTAAMTMSSVPSPVSGETLPVNASCPTPANAAITATMANPAIFTWSVLIPVYSAAFISPPVAFTR
jgi:hypothetical protein